LEKCTIIIPNQFKAHVALLSDFKNISEENLIGEMIELKRCNGHSEPFLIANWLQSCTYTQNTASISNQVGAKLN